MHLRVHFVKYVGPNVAFLAVQMYKSDDCVSCRQNRICNTTRVPRISR